MDGELPLVVIVGPTASGKTSLAIRLAKEFGGEVISADSRAVYRGLDIGTAKPTVEERAGVPHWGIDIVDLGERFTVVDFQRYAQQAIQDIRSRGHIPFLVGGTGLYVHSVVYGYRFPEGTQDLVRREELQSWSIEELHRYCEEHNVELPENKYNKRYVVNNILRQGQKHKRSRRPIAHTIVVGIATEKSELHDRIATRANSMWEAGLVDEADRMSRHYGWELEAMTGNTYRVARQYLEGKLSEDVAKERLIVLDRQLAKRQLTWFRRDEHIVWLDIEVAYTYIAQLLAACSDS